jgi:hypothetical protein
MNNFSRPIGNLTLYVHDRTSRIASAHFPYLIRSVVAVSKTLCSSVRSEGAAEAARLPRAPRFQDLLLSGCSHRL